MTTVVSRGIVLAALSVALYPVPTEGQSSVFIRGAQLADGVYLFSDTVSGAVNSVAIINETDVILFDAGSRPLRERLVLEELRRLTAKPVRAVINSHWHPDHWSGNAVWRAEFPGAQFIATTQSRDIMRNVAPSWPPIYAGIRQRRDSALAAAIASGKNADGSTLTAEQRRTREANNRSYSAFADEMVNLERVFPTLTFNDSLTLVSGDREFRLMSLDGDAVGSAVLYLPRERIVVAGDLLVHPVTWTTNSFRIMPWIASLKAVRSLDARIIVPGHGPAFQDPEYLTAVIDLFEGAVAQVHAALARGLVSPEEVRRAVDLEPLRARFTRGRSNLDADFTATVDALVRKVYQESRDGMESRR